MNESNLRRIIREEIRRARTGAQCPECHEPVAYTLEEIESDIASGLDWHYACEHCETESPVESLDPVTAD